MKGIKHLIVLFTIFQLSASAQLSQQDANNLVNNYLSTKNLPANYSLCTFGERTANFQLLTTKPGKAIATPNENSYVFFVDEYPLANWGHKCRYLFVGKNSGALTDVEEFLPPRDFDIVTVLKAPPIQGEGPKFNFSKRLKSGISPDHCYAVIISGGDSRGWNSIRYWNDCQAFYNLLTQVYGYKRDHITCIVSDGTNPNTDRALTPSPSTVWDSSPLDFDGDGLDDIQYEANRANISQVFDNLKNVITPDDFVVVFTTDHGNLGPTEAYINLWYDYIGVTDFNNELNKLNAGNICVVMEQCYSGNFIPSVCSNNNTILTACEPNMLSYARNWTYDEFVYQFICAASRQDPTGNPVNSDANFDGRVSLEEIHTYAKANDIRPEIPQYCSSGFPMGNSLDLNGEFCGYSNLQYPLMDQIEKNCIVDATNTMVMSLQGLPTIFQVKYESNLYNFTVQDDAPYFEIQEY